VLLKVESKKLRVIDQNAKNDHSSSSDFVFGLPFQVLQEVKSEK
jgi:hypothetical protein